MSIWPAAPEPKTELGRYRVLSSTAGIRVSPLQLGCMSFGDTWSSFMGSMTKERTFEILDAYVAAGGNILDNSNNYQCEQSEQWLGEWISLRGNRDQLVITTKFTMNYRSWELGTDVTVNHAGNHKRSLKLSLRDSLKKLNTDWIDILYVHWWDYTTSIPELMDSLDAVVKQGTVLYLGISDTPAWIVSACNEYATAHGKTPFSVYQGRWNIMRRDFERDILPMARHYGMALAPWDSIGGGKFQTKEAIAKRATEGAGRFGQQSEAEIAYSEALEKVAQEQGTKSVTAIALAYVMAKAPNVFPIIGGRKVEHLLDNIQALKIRLTEEQIRFLESVRPFDIGFPTDFIGEDPHVTRKSGELLASMSTMAFVESQKAIGY